MCEKKTTVTTTNLVRTEQRYSYQWTRFPRQDNPRGGEKLRSNTEHDGKHRLRMKDKPLAWFIYKSVEKEMTPD